MGNSSYLELYPFPKRESALIRDSLELHQNGTGDTLPPSREEAPKAWLSAKPRLNRRLTVEKEKRIDACFSVKSLRDSFFDRSSMIDDDHDYEYKDGRGRMEDYCASGRVSSSPLYARGIFFVLGGERRSRFSRETGFHRGVHRGDPGIARESNRASCSRDLVAVLTGVG